MLKQPEILIIVISCMQKGVWSSQNWLHVILQQGKNWKSKWTPGEQILDLSIQNFCHCSTIFFLILKFSSIFLFSLNLIILVFEYDQSWFISSFCIALPNSSIRFNPSYSHHLWLWEHKCGRSDEIKRSKISWKKQPETTKSMEFFYLLRSQSLLWNEGDQRN